MNILSLHNLLHRAGVEIAHRSDKFMEALLFFYSHEIDTLGDTETRLREICEFYSIPQIPTDRIVGALLKGEVLGKVLAPGPGKAPVLDALSNGPLPPSHPVQD